MHRDASRLARCATAFGGFGLDPTRSMPAGLVIDSTPFFKRIAVERNSVHVLRLTSGLSYPRSCRSISRNPVTLPIVEPCCSAAAALAARRGARIGHALAVHCGRRMGYVGC